MQESGFPLSSLRSGAARAAGGATLRRDQPEPVAFWRALSAIHPNVVVSAGLAEGSTHGQSSHSSIASVVSVTTTDAHRTCDDATTE